MADIPIARVGADTAGVDSLDAAAHGVFGSLANDDSNEHAGVILQGPDGKYYHTDPISSAEHDHFGLRIQMKQGWKVAGVYHTHPGEDNLGQYFSPNDLQVAESLKVPSYVRFHKDGAVRRYTPGQSKTQNIQWPGNRSGLRVASGDSVPAPVSPAVVAGAVGGPALSKSAIQNPQVASAISSWAQNNGVKTQDDLARYLASRSDNTQETQ